MNIQNAKELVSEAEDKQQVSLKYKQLQPLAENNSNCSLYVLLQGKLCFVLDKICGLIKEIGNNILNLSGGLEVFF